MRCVHCNGEHPDGFKFCPVTGKEMVQQFKACTNPECADFEKHILPPDALFCPRCGSRIECPQDNKGRQSVVNTKKKKRNPKKKIPTNRESQSSLGIYISNTVKEVISENWGLDLIDVVDSANLAIDLGADELDAFLLFRDFEKVFNVVMPDDVDPCDWNVDDIIKFIKLIKC